MTAGVGLGVDARDLMASKITQKEEKVGTGGSETPPDRPLHKVPMKILSGSFDRPDKSPTSTVLEAAHAS